ncbi:ATP-binding protein [Nocardioides bizhenqiangii]|uniref:BTAD domain-containing putative transcriptional regulator n=1 Tax=Nocardioides bizhenqiangii TaxID=3095076 RepID=A0ABZ0ZPQ9_9ACTN|nr:BTAD domain-containing putative transcriptional regulator [Nocardioides sp. HM61]WQQ26351.1 BTAD domain-containing putative transcriptional regulator [Nocardioides sp. HM61]
MWVGVLGPTVVTDTAGENRSISLPAAKHRALIAALALHAGRPVSPDVLVDTIWRPEAPPSALGTLQTYVSVVRRALEPDLPARTASSYLASSDQGYLLRADIDADHFTRAVRSVHDAIAPLTGSAVPVATDLDRAEAQLRTVDAALGQWRGTPYVDLPDSDTVLPERSRLTELRLLALEDRATLLVAVGRDAEATAELEALVIEHPLRERLSALLAVALARTGRQADALAALDRLRVTLDEELGLEPGPATRHLQTAILRHEVAPAPTVPIVDEGAVGGLPEALPQPEITVPDWPLVGRDAHLEVLESLLTRAGDGQPQFVTIVGEPGAGKSRLGAEFALRARAGGATVLVGRCSQEEDAPPLWPWATALGAPMPAATEEDRDDHDAARFAISESIRRTLVDLSRDRTVVLGLEDLHWADPLSLRVLRHLAAHTDTARLVVVCTWRRGTQVGPLAEAAEALARRHATTLEVNGLSADETAHLLATITGDTDPALATSVHQRTEGNPFFLIEYGRLARDEHRDLHEVLEAMPPTVAAVVERRIAQLPEDSRRALTAGAAIGREFELSLLAAALEQPELDVLDLLEPALVVDLVQDLGGDRFRFGHALVRDTAYGVLTPSRRERLHARLAGLVQDAPDGTRRAPEVARHWAAAGRRHVRAAHLAAARAGALAMTAHAADEATQHLAHALELHADDPAGTEDERYELLVRYAEACRWSTRRLEMHGALDEAIVIAGRLGDPDLVVRAAATATADALWPARAYGEANHAVIDVIRSALTLLPRDSAVRCRLLLALAAEAYYATSPEEREDTCDEAVRIARGSGDERLLMEALMGSAVATFRRANADRRRLWVEEALVLAHRAGDVRARTNLRALLAPIRCELGEVDGIDEELADIIRFAHQDKQYFVEMVTLNLAHCWATMRGDAGAIEGTMVQLREAFDLVSTAHKVDTVRGAQLYEPLWNPEAALPGDDEVAAFMTESSIPAGPAATVLTLRHGQTDLARFVFDTYGIDLDTDNWFSPFVWSLGAEIGLELAEPDVAAGAYARLAPYRGTCVISGTSPAHGPVDAYLALASAATGETRLAAQHAEQALELIAAWRIPRVEKWFLDLRDRHGF